MRRKARIDDNQKQIVTQLRAYGCSVFSTASIGKGFPDIVVGYRGKNYMFEIKDGAKSKSRQKLTPDEQKFFETWRGQIAVIKNIYDALIVIGIHKKD